MGIEGVKEAQAQVKNCVKFAIEDMSGKMAGALVGYSPVWAGDYVQSHVAEDAPKQYPRDNALLPPGMWKQPLSPPASQALKLKVKSALEKRTAAIALKTGKVAINNTAKHAAMVEHHKYQTSGGIKVNKPFGKTKASMSMREKSIIDNAKHRAFK